MARHWAAAGQNYRVVNANDWHLAQALTARKPIAIFDEPTSALDSNMAQRMVQTIKRQRQGQTTIMIVHDHGLLAMADHVIRMP